MEGIGDRLKARAAELGLSGAEVARRAGLTATRYGHYLQDIREPDLATLVHVCRVLGLRPDVLLAYNQAALDAGSLDLALSVVQAIAATVGLRSAATALGPQQDVAVAGGVHAVSPPTSLGGASTLACGDARRPERIANGSERA